MRHLPPPIQKLTLIGLFSILLLALANGCVMNQQAESEWNWQQQNPGWKPTAPPDGKPKWGFFSAPE